MRATVRLGLGFLLLTLASAGAQPSLLSSVTLAPVTVGTNVTALPGPWRFNPGDDPAWSSPAFDDSAWSRMDLAAGDAINPAYGNRGYITGWTARGYPLLAGFAWYRLRIHVDDAAVPLAIKMPDSFDDAYQVFANGRLLGGFGNFDGNGVVAYRSQPRSFELPSPDTHGDILLAIRFYAQPSAIVAGNSPDSGGMHETPLVGEVAEIEFIRAAEVRERVLAFITTLFVAAMQLIAAAGAFWIATLDRDRYPYLWLTIALLSQAAATVLTFTSLFVSVDQNWSVALASGLGVFQLAAWLFFWRCWFDLPRNRSVDVLLAACTVVLLAGNFVIFFYKTMPVAAFAWDTRIMAGCTFIFVSLLVVFLAQAARKDRIGALLAFPAIVLFIVSSFGAELLSWLRIRTIFFPGGLQISVEEVSFVLLILVVGALVTRRFVASQVAQMVDRRAIEKDLEQARILQQAVLAPELIRSPMFHLETEYHPARTVGGDFFQVIAGKAASAQEGKLLIVLGDVSGKGVSAAMLVAVLIGAIRSEADHTFDPAAILHTLNQRLLGRAGGHFATCLAACLMPDNTLLIANAGHIPPYRNGAALELAGSLPLGLDAKATYEVEAVPLHPADRLVFVTDGVPEARNAEGQLLGFEATEQLSGQSAALIASAAITHGQDDDITILSLTLAPSLAGV